jgi:hypothetical protein
MRHQRRHICLLRAGRKRHRRLLTRFTRDLPRPSLLQPRARGDKGDERIGQFHHQDLAQICGQVLPRKQRVTYRGQMTVAVDNSAE